MRGNRKRIVSILCIALLGMSLLSGCYRQVNGVTWNQEAAGDSGKIALTPGATEKSLMFAWYSLGKGTPAVQISRNSSMIGAKTYKGKATSIQRKNWKHTYLASNKVTVSNQFSNNTTYYYRYTDDISKWNVTWSHPYQYSTRDPRNFQVCVLGDVQIGGSGETGEGTPDDKDIERDVASYEATLTQALKKAPKMSFIMSAGDQTNVYKKDAKDKNNVRESEFAGFLFPEALRNVPIATTVGNHDNKGTAYQYHFHNPNTSKQRGKTRAGCDYYYKYGNTLFIVLNTNSKNASQHKKLMKEATEKYKKVRWKVVMFHHDIYGSGVLHSNKDSKKVRKWLAPIMDQYKIDLCIAGHDHCYARSYQLKGGKIYKYRKKRTVTNPKGTVYFSLGSSTGSKFYSLAKKKQSYVAQRREKAVPTFSILKITNHKLVFQTYDYYGKEYADTYTIKK